ncbi:SPOR domain-containing protein [Algibacter aquimarinus]|uniref:SPOR domain-containing protein n=1 Tax=Algibacter aquimarinus TaxID=1136748 RepID=A0ABP9HCJ5_9FLAO
MQLETYISDLLYRYECVTIPDFGAFLTQSASARIEETSNAFYPPKKVLSFNEQIQKNDGLLANYIADVEKIPFEIATKKIEKRVKILKAYLTQGETLTFNNIGEIAFNPEGKIMFEPSYHLNYLTDAFGLSQFVSPSINREVYKEDVENIEKVVPITVTPEKRKSRPYFKYAAVALIALTLGGLTASNYYVGQIEKHNQLAQEKATQQLDNKIQQATFNLNPLPAITLNVTKQSGNYHIVAGAFRIEENCDKKIKELKANGFNARKLGINKYGLHEVVYGSYETGKEALEAVREIRKTHNKDAWLKVDSKSNNLKSSPETPYVANTTDSQIITPEVKQPIDATTSEEYSKGPNIIKIIKDIKGVESGFYLIFDVCKDTQKRDDFLTKLRATENQDIDFFFDSESSNYFIYNQKYDTLEAATKALKSNETSPLYNNMFLVKVN